MIVPYLPAPEGENDHCPRSFLRTCQDLESESIYILREVAALDRR
jgi:hypothetical protein